MNDLRFQIITLFIITSILLSIGCKRPARSEFINHDYDDLQIDTLQFKIAKKLNESSGLININGNLWTHNDSGGEPSLYETDSNAVQITRILVINNTQNTDWEEITKDSTHVYIGNFGNNMGSRKDLEIYKISIEAMLSQETVEPKIIKFHYPEQEVSPGSYDHNFDAEAFITQDDSLYLFTKNWQNGQCSLYALPTTEGTYPARLISTFDTKGTITGATYNPILKEVVLIGYNYDGKHNEFHPFIWILSDYSGRDFFSGKQQRYNLNLVRQAEAIVWHEDDKYYFSAEQDNSGYAALFSLTIP